MAAPANQPDHTLLDATLDTLAPLGPLPDDATLHLDAGYDNNPARDAIDAHDLAAQIAPKGVKTPIHHSPRWVIERTNSWCNNFAKIRRNTERRRPCVHFYLDAPASSSRSAASSSEPGNTTDGNPTPQPSHPMTYWRTH